MSATNPCPFCGEPDYDLVGLKSHLAKGECEAYEALEVIRSPFDGINQRASDDSDKEWPAWDDEKGYPFPREIPLIEAPACPHCGTKDVSKPRLMQIPGGGKFWECRACGWEAAR